MILPVQFPEKSRNKDAALCERWREITKQLSRWQLRRPRPLCIPITPHPLRHQGRLSNCPVHVGNLFVAILAVRLWDLHIKMCTTCLKQTNVRKLCYLIASLQLIYIVTP